MGRLLGEIGVWVANVAGVSALVALFEIVIEKDQGWAKALGEAGWGRKLLAGTAVVRWIDKPYVTSYHLLVFGGILPLALWTQYRVGMLAGWVSASRAGHPFADFLFLLSELLAICILEDFLWFLLNWHYPRSLTDLLAGEVWWHTHWVPLGPSVKVPRCYLSVGGIALALLAISVVLPR